MGKLLVRRLRLVGGSHPYDVSFLDDDGNVSPLSVIAGQISTGKTSILQFISYCLGGSDFPHHHEIRTRVRGALLECELHDDVYVIERAAVEQPSRTAHVHSCSLEAIAEPHPIVEYNILPSSSPDSLSQFLLEKLGIGVVMLKEAPTQASSAAVILSIRDVMRLMLVEHHDLDGDNLLHENSNYMVRLKHLQVLDLMFWVHDNLAASLANELNAIEARITERERDLQSIETLFAEQHLPDRAELKDRLGGIEAAMEGSREQLSAIEEGMSAAAAFGDEQRAAYQQAAQSARRLTNQRRDLTTQMDRLTALAAQYDQDVKKLGFAKEASLLFDPLAIEVCPWCLQTVSISTASMDGHCSVCHQALTSTEETVDVDRELKAVKTRQKELSEYLAELVEQERTVSEHLEGASRDQQRVQRIFDDAMQARFSPFMAQRDTILGELNHLSAEKQEIQRLAALHISRDRRREELGSLRQQQAETKLKQAEATAGANTRVDVIASLTERYASTLAQFHFPKLSDAYLDPNYTPFVRGLRYDKVGSAGATTLISLAWYLSLFEESVSTGGAHPGLLMLDSPQKNLIPATGQATDDFQAPAIALGVYEHLLNWCTSESGVVNQLIVVDNDPPSMAEAHLRVRYTGDPAVPPYGLIDDAVE
jgi:hypothetical protein